MLSHKSLFLKAVLGILTVALLYLHADMAHNVLNKVQLKFLSSIFQNLQVN